jgi:hypothetical protein
LSFAGKKIPIVFITLTGDETVRPRAARHRVPWSACQAIQRCGSA